MMRIILILVATLLTNSVHAQTTHYFSFTPWSFNPSFRSYDPIHAINFYFKTYPSIGYGFYKGRWNLAINFWWERPYSGAALRTYIPGQGYLIKGKLVVKNARAMYVEGEVAYSKEVKYWLRVNAGISGQIYAAMYDVAMILYDSTYTKRGFPEMYNVSYLGIPFRIGITVFPFKRAGIGLSLDLLWHVIYEFNYDQFPIIITGWETDKPLKPYIPEIRLRLHVVFFRSSGGKANSETHSN